MSLPPAVEQQVQDFIDTHGEAALELALGSGQLFANMLRASEIYWRTSMQLFEAGAPSTLVVQLDPTAKRQAPKVDVQGAYGSVQLSFPISVARSA